MQEGELGTLHIVRITQLLGDEINCNSQRQSFRLYKILMRFSCLDKTFLGRGLLQKDTVFLKICYLAVSVKIRGIKF